MCRGNVLSDDSFRRKSENWIWASRQSKSILRIQSRKVETDRLPAMTASAQMMNCFGCTPQSRRTWHWKGPDIPRGDASPSGRREETAFHLIRSSVLEEWRHLDQCKQPAHTFDGNRRLPWPYCSVQVIQRSEVEGHDIDTSTHVADLRVSRLHA